MTEQTKRQQLEVHLTRRALADPDFRDELLRNPKGAIEKEIGLRFPEGLNVSVHEEKLHHLHVVLPVDLVTSADLVPALPDWSRVDDERKQLRKKN